MLSILTAYTLEADDGAYALQEVLQQLNLEKRGKKHTAGLIYCHPDFVEGGVAHILAEALPFEVVGCTVAYNMIDGMDAPLMLNVTVFTSDDVEFATMRADGLERPDAIEKGYHDATGGGVNQPSLIIPFFPLAMPVGAESLLDAFDRASGGVPLFGTLAFDSSTGYQRWQVLYQGEASRDIVSALFFFGDVQPGFYLASMSEMHTQKERAAITKSRDNTLMEVNHMPLVKYLEGLGFSKAESIQQLVGVPFVLNHGDGSKATARAMHTFTPEGYAVCSGTMPENATLSLGSLTYGDILRMTEEALKAALASGKTAGMLLHPCGSHYMVMGVDAQDQKETVTRLIPPEIPFQMAYSGGEICPVVDGQGHLKNRFHGYTFAVCAF